MAELRSVFGRVRCAARMPAAVSPCRNSGNETCGRRLDHQSVICSGPSGDSLRHSLWASKAAVRQLTKSVAQHCAQEKLNIRCNSVHPGNVRTPRWDKQAEETARARSVDIEDIIAEVKARNPMGDLGSPEDIAAVVSFLASEETRHMTGAKLIVDGGIVNCDAYRISANTPARIVSAGPSHLPINANKG